jgi:hypothetical protein
MGWVRSAVARPPSTVIDTDRGHGGLPRQSEPSRPSVCWSPLTHVEPVDALGAATKLVEAAGLAFALRLLHTPAGGARRYPRYEKELVYEQ